jgi:hypothetical protein
MEKLLVAHVERLLWSRRGSNPVPFGLQSNASSTKLSCPPLVIVSQFQERRLLVCAPAWELGVAPSAGPSGPALTALGLLDLKTKNSIQMQAQARAADFRTGGALELSFARAFIFTSCLVQNCRMRWFSLYIIFCIQRLRHSGPLSARH